MTIRENNNTRAGDPAPDRESLLLEIEGLRRKLAESELFEKRVSEVVHDLRNPLSAIIGRADLLGLQLKDKPKLLASTRQIHSAVMALDRLITDVRDVAAIHNETFLIDPRVCDLGAAIAGARPRLDEAAQQQGVSLEFVVPEGMPPFSGDPGAILRLIEILGLNAVYYTPEKGRVTLSVAVLDDSVKVAVTDNGIGIPKEDQPRIYERFFRSTNAEEFHPKGFGLGLTIAKAIVGLHEGSLAFESVVGSGSRFSFTLPLKRPVDAK